MTVSVKAYGIWCGTLLGLLGVILPTAAQTKAHGYRSLSSESNQQLAARSVLRASAGVTDGEEVGLSGELAFTLLQNGAGLVRELEAGLGIVYMPPPCPVDIPPTQAGGGPCPDGSEYIGHLMLSIRPLVAGPLSLRAGVGAGAAYSGAVTSDEPNALLPQERTAPTVAYGAAVDVTITSRFILFGQYRGFSIFTGERDFIGPNGNTTRDIGTQSKYLLSAGIGVRF